MVIVTDAIEGIKEIESKKLHYIVYSLNKKEVVFQVNSTISYGNLSFRYGPHQEVLLARELFFSHLQIVVKEFLGQIRHKINFKTNFMQPILMLPSHSNSIEVVDRHTKAGWKSLEGAVKADGLLLYPLPANNVLPLGVLTADCAPVTMYLPSAQTLALFHVSRKNLDIIEDGLLLMKGLYYAQNKSSDLSNFNLVLFVGPSGKYPFVIKGSIVEINIRDEIKEKIDCFEKTQGIPPQSIKVYFSKYFTTDENSFFFSHHLSHNNQEGEKRFMSLSMII